MAGRGVGDGPGEAELKVRDNSCLLEKADRSPAVKGSRFKKMLANRKELSRLYLG